LGITLSQPTEIYFVRFLAARLACRASAGLDAEDFDSRFSARVTALLRFRDGLRGLRLPCPTS
jgi:hypothetical protein